MVRLREDRRARCLVLVLAGRGGRRRRPQKIYRPAGKKRVRPDVLALSAGAGAVDHRFRTVVVRNQLAALFGRRQGRD